MKATGPHFTSASRLLAVGAISFAACKDEQKQAQVQPEVQQEEGPQQVEIDDIEDEAEKFYGKRVELRGEVDDVLGAQAFELESDDFFEDDLLVVMKGTQRLDASATEDSEVMVKGVVRQLVITEVEREIGWDLDPQIEIEYESKPVLVADSLEVLRTDDDRQPQAGTDALITDLQTLARAENPEQMIGKRVELENINVRNVTGDKAFWIGPSHTEQLLVALGEEPKTPDTPIEGKVKVVENRPIARLTGTVERLPSSSEMQAKWDLDETERRVLDNMKIYIKADRVEMGQT